ncbi:MAG: hypothetical protein ACI4XQ_01170, partial [Eubacteriales bacterium]
KTNGGANRAIFYYFSETEICSKASKMLVGILCGTKYRRERLYGYSRRYFSFIIAGAFAPAR